MKVLKTLVVAITLLLLLPSVSAQDPQRKNADYDAVRDFSIQSNPNGPWSYGYMTGSNSPFTLYTVPDTDCYPGYSFSGWHKEGACYIPFLLHNDSDKVICWETFCIPTTYLFLSPGPDNGSSVLRWTAPSSGRFLLEGKFVGLDCCTTSTYVHVLLNSKRCLLKAPITSYKWPLSFDPKALWLSAGDD